MGEVLELQDPLRSTWELGSTDGLISVIDGRIVSVHRSSIWMCAELLAPSGAASWHRLCAAPTGYFQQPQGETVTDASALCTPRRGVHVSKGSEGLMWHCTTSGCRHGDGSWEVKEWLEFDYPPPQNKMARNHPSTPADGIPCVQRVCV